MTANEAKAIADSYEARQMKHEQNIFVRIKRYFEKKKLESATKNRLRHYLNIIEDTSRDGEYEVRIHTGYPNWNSETDPECFDRLKKMGYKVTVTDHGTINEVRYISWRGK